MTSSLTWLDHSDKERRRVLDAIDRFKETDTRDELGLASIRDGISEHFFPGTSVLMTRVRYFLFIPWIYLEIERRGWRDNIEARVRRAEVQLIEALGDQPGTIGKLAKGTLKRMPSNIFWLGLERWGIKSNGRSQGDHHLFLESGGAAANSDEELEDDDGEPVNGSRRRTWHAAIPKAPEGFPKEATFELRSSEAEYLRERIRLSAPRSLLALLLRPGYLPDVEYAWLHPKLADFPSDLRRSLHHAQCLAETMQGAALLYNLMLAEAGNRDTVDAFRERIKAWTEELGARRHELANWNVGDFWQFASSVANVRDATRSFVNKWIESRPWEDAMRAADDPSLRALIRHREQQLKGGRARLVNPRALELWGGESGTGRLVYRWPTAYRLVSDIVGVNHA